MATSKNFKPLRTDSLTRAKRRAYLRAPSIEAVETIDLTSTDRLKQLYLQAVAKGYVPNNERSVHEFVCLAEKALHDDPKGTPGALFYYLVKNGATQFVTEAQDARASSRLHGGERSDLVYRAGTRDHRTIQEYGKDEVTNHFVGRNVGLLPSHLVQCFFPQRPLPIDVREWDTSHGKAAVRVKAGEIGLRGVFEPDGSVTMIPRPVPSGFRPRLILPYITRYAVQHKTRYIDMGKSLRDFCGEMGITWNGRNGRALTTAVQDLAASDVVLAWGTEDRVITKYNRVASSVSFWIQRDQHDKTFWQPEMELNPEFYYMLLVHSVPIDMDHLAQFIRSPRRMDLYVWLTYRTFKIGDRPVSVPLRLLQPIFAPEIKDMNKFKQKLKDDLRAIAQVYGGFRVQLKGDYLRLAHSTPPITPHLTLKSS